MSTPKDGGPAFPTGPLNRADTLPGMTLRDYFASLAMQSMFAGAGARMVADRDGRYDETNWAEVVSANAYEMADAMLTERAKETKA